MIDMVGIGPFVTLSLVASAMHGSASILAWALGAVLALMDGMVWAELGARWPEAGGSYVFLKKLFPGQQMGRLMPFLFIWQTTIQAPLVVASGAIGFADYFGYFANLSELQHKMVSGGVVLLMTALLYRNVKSIGRISVFLWAITGGTMLWLICSAFGHFDAGRAFHLNLGSFPTYGLLFAALGQASVKSVYSYLGYYNVCHLGAEIKNPERNIPRSIMLSVVGIAILYLCMQIAVSGVLPAEALAAGAAKGTPKNYAVSLYFQTIYHSRAVAGVATVLILVIAGASLFSAMLGYSRIPYAAALNGDFFPVFAKVHPKHKFPYVSLIAIGSAGFVFSLLFRLADVISAILVMRILIQFGSQAVALIAMRYRTARSDWPYRMPLFPLPAIIAIFIWLFIFCTSGKYIWWALLIVTSGTIAFFIRDRWSKKR